MQDGYVISCSIGDFSRFWAAWVSQRDGESFILAGGNFFDHWSGNGARALYRVIFAHKNAGV